MKKFLVYKDVVLGVIVIIVSILYGISSFKIELRVVSTGITAATIPRLLAVTELVLGILLTARGLFSARASIKAAEKHGGQSGQEAEEKTDYSAVLQTVILLIFYVLAFRPLGFIVSSIIFMFLEMIVVCPKSEKKNYKVFAIVSVVTAFSVYFLFRYAFDQMLPTGIMEFMEYII